MSYKQPVTAEVLARLTEGERRELVIKQRNHSMIWDPALHRVSDCPFGYTLTYMFTFNKTTEKWARYILKFYRTSHDRENHCTCDAQLVAPDKPPKGD